MTDTATTATDTGPGQDPGELADLADRLAADRGLMAALRSALARRAGPLRNMLGQDIGLLAAGPTGRVQVSPGQQISSSAWGNPIWDQSVNCFASAADRDAQWPTPHDGSICFHVDTHTPWIYRGGAWHGIPLGLIGAAAGPTSGTDYTTFAAVTGAQVVFTAQPGRKYMAFSYGTGVVVTATSTNSLISMRSTVGVDRADPVNTSGQTIPANATLAGAANLMITNAGAAHTETVAMTALSGTGALRVVANAITLAVMDIGS